MQLFDPCDVSAAVFGHFANAWLSVAGVAERVPCLFSDRLADGLQMQSRIKTCGCLGADLVSAGITLTNGCQVTIAPMLVDPQTLTVVSDPVVQSSGWVVLTLERDHG